MNEMWHKEREQNGRCKGPGNVVEPAATVLRTKRSIEQKPASQQRNAEFPEAAE